MKEAASMSEMSVNFYQTTWHNNPVDRHLHTCHRKNLKSHLTNLAAFTFCSFFFGQGYNLIYIVGNFMRCYLNLSCRQTNCTPLILKCEYRKKENKCKK
jgi:hypothetical protein